VRVTYTLRHATLGTQFRFGQQPLKKTLVAASQPKRAVYGTVYIEKPGTYPFSFSRLPREPRRLSSSIR
jgi:hypothetical protein